MESILSYFNLGSRMTIRLQGFPGMDFSIFFSKDCLLYINLASLEVGTADRLQKVIFVLAFIYKFDP